MFLRLWKLENQFSICLQTVLLFWLARFETRAVMQVICGMKKWLQKRWSTVMMKKRQPQSDRQNSRVDLVVKLTI